MEKLKYQIVNEIKGLDEYVKAMKKVYTKKGLLEDLDNLLLHIGILKSWAGIDVETSENSLHKHIVSKAKRAVCPNCDNPYFHKTKLGDCWCEDCGNEWQTDC